MPAANLKFKYRQGQDFIASPRVKKAKGVKVIKLPVNRRSKFKGLSEAKQQELVINYRIKARKLARSILRKWHSRLDLQEVDSVVDLSLCEAVRRYNPRKGASFMTFLFYHMRGNLIRAVSLAANANVIPHTDEPFEAKGDVPVSLNAIEIAEALCSRDYLSPDESLLKSEIASLSQEACAKLDDLEREVVERIYVHEQQLMDIAISLGYSRCHISRVKKKALETLFQELSTTLHVGDENSARECKFRLAEESELEIDRRRIYRRRPRVRKTVRVESLEHRSVTHRAVA